MDLTLNESGLERCRAALAGASQLRVVAQSNPCGTTLIDCGIEAAGGLRAGIAVAEVCLAGLAQVQITHSDPRIWEGPAVLVQTDHPVAACMAAQYAGWPIGVEQYFAMGSGPMRAARGREPLLQEIRVHETPAAVVGVLESRQLPTVAVCKYIAEQCGVDSAMLTLLVAPTSSLAGTVQVVSRSIETALHKLHELGYPLSQVRSGLGTAPLPPVAGDDLTGIARTNDAVLYGGQVTLWVTDDDQRLREIGPQVPSSSSPEYGQPFCQIFEDHGQNFYEIDPLLFSPAVVTLNNLNSGQSFRFGQLRSDVLHKSFGTGGAK